MTAIILTVLTMLIRNPEAIRTQGIRKVVTGTVAEMAARWTSYAVAGERWNQLLEEPAPYRI